MSAVTLGVRVRVLARVWAAANAIALYPAQRAARLPTTELLRADPITARSA